MAYQPKSYKKFVATAATATLVATAVVPAAFADDVKTAAFTDVAPQYKAAVDFVVEQAIAKGISETQFGISKEIIRGDAAIMIANAAGLNNPDAPSSGFTDVPTRGALAINSLKAAGVTNGVSATQFDFNGDITRGEAAIFLANAFELKGDTSNVKFTDVNSRYMAAVAALVDNGVTNGKSATQFGTDDNITRGDFARWIHALEEYIVKDEAAVASVTPINSKQVVVEFKTALNSDSAVADDATELDNYTLDGVSADEVVLSADKKSVTLMFYSGIEGTDQVFVVNPTATNVKDENGEWVKTEKYSTLLTYADTAKPVVTGTSYDGGEITLTFSEDLSSEPEVVRVNNQPISADDYEIVDFNTVVIQKSLNANETASLYVAGAKDDSNAENVMEVYNGSVTAPSADLEKPRVTSVQVTGQNTATVTLSEAVDQNSIPVILQQGANQDSEFLEIDTDDASGKTYTLTVDGLFPSGSTSTSETFTLFIEEDVMTDLSPANNANDFYSTTVKFVRDTVSPKLSSARVATDKETLDLSFNESLVKVGSSSSITVRNSEGVNFPVNSESALDLEDDKTFEVDFLTGEQEIEAGTYTVTIPAGFFTDEYGNATSEVKTTVVVPVSAEDIDNDAPIATITEGAKNNSYLVSFDDEMSQNALSLSSYRLDGQSLPAGTDIFFTNADKNVVSITLPVGSVNIGNQTDGAPALFTVLNATDTSGNKVKTTDEIVYIYDNTAAKISSVQVAGDEVVVTFNEALDIDGAVGVDADDVFNIVSGSSTLTAGALEAVGTSETQVKFTLDKLPTGSVTVTVDAEQSDLTDANGYEVK